MGQYLYQFLPGDRPELRSDPSAWTPDDERIAEEHFEYLKQATDQGVVVMAGRSQDWVGPAVVVIDVDSESEAESFMRSDPFVANNLFRASLHPFRVALMRPTSE